jgi:hypothetical protein
MPTHFLQYWEPKQIDYTMDVDDVLTHSGSDQFRRMKIQPGDTVWIVTVRRSGELTTIGRIQVDRVVSYREAVRHFGKNVWESRDHIIAKVGTEEEMREVNLMDVAAQLRFQSKRDRLAISDGRMKAQQLQTIRKLTPASAALLSSKWYSTELPSAPELEERISKSGAGYGDPAANREVESAAVSFVTKHYEDEGWKVESVELKKCGYDLRCTKKGAEESVEVKGVRGTGLSFIITANEVKQARNNSGFVICIVNSALSANPQMTRYSGKDLIDNFEFVDLAYRASLRK